MVTWRDAVDDQGPIVDYSSPGLERARERAEEGQRREGIENYNEATFGERRPVVAAFLRVAVLGVVAALCVFFLPRRIGVPVFYLILGAFTVWIVVRNGVRPGSSLRHPWRWW